MIECPAWARRVGRSSYPLVREVGDAQVYLIDENLPERASLSVVRYPTRRRTPTHRHSGGEHHFVLDGRVIGEYMGRSFEFSRGDYFYWDGDGEHTASNADARTAEVAILRVHMGSTGLAFGGEALESIDGVLIARHAGPSDPPAPARVRQLSSLLPQGLGWWLVDVAPQAGASLVAMEDAGRCLVVSGNPVVVGAGAPAALDPGDYIQGTGENAAPILLSVPPAGAMMLAIAAGAPRVLPESAGLR